VIDWNILHISTYHGLIWKYNDFLFLSKENWIFKLFKIVVVIIIIIIIYNLFEDATQSTKCQMTGR
jgi:chromate transport protein ChrA